MSISGEWIITVMINDTILLITSSLFLLFLISFVTFTKKKKKKNNLNLNQNLQFGKCSFKCSSNTKEKKEKLQFLIFVLKGKSVN